jgi:hypothetical protein
VVHALDERSRPGPARGVSRNARDAGFAAFAILVAGLGIGAGSTVFSVVNALLLRPLPFRDAGSLVWISNEGQNNEEWATQVDHFVDLRQGNQSFSGLAGWNGYYGVGNRQLTGSGEPERLTSVSATENLFSVLGVQPVLGRSFTAEECQGKSDAPPAMLMSYGFGNAWEACYSAYRPVIPSHLPVWEHCCLRLRPSRDIFPPGERRGSIRWLRCAPIEGPASTTFNTLCRNCGRTSRTYGVKGVVGRCRR